MKKRGGEKADWDGMRKEKGKANKGRLWSQRGRKHVVVDLVGRKGTNKRRKDEKGWRVKTGILG